MSEIDEIMRTARNLSASRWAKLLTVLGIVAIICSLIVLSLRLNYLLGKEKQQSILLKREMRVQEGILDEARQAVANGDVDGAARLLNVAIVTTQTVGEMAQANIVAPTKPNIAAIPEHDPVVAATPAREWDQTVYIQFAGIQRDEIMTLNKKLRARGWRGVQSSSGERTQNASGVNQIRYHNETDRPAAEALAAAINAESMTRVPVVPKEMSIIGKGILEVWVSK